jgi:hypothetical protein
MRAGTTTSTALYLRVAFPLGSRSAHHTSGITQEKRSILSKQVALVLAGHGLTEEECTQPDAFGLTILHLASVLGPCRRLSVCLQVTVAQVLVVCGGGTGAVETQQLTSDIEVLPFSVTLSLHLVNHILTHFKVPVYFLPFTRDTRHTTTLRLTAALQDQVINAVDDRGDTALHKVIAIAQRPGAVRSSRVTWVLHGASITPLAHVVRACTGSHADR